MTLILAVPDDLETLVYHLLEVELDAIDATLAAVRRLGDDEIASQMRQFVAEHHRQVRDLADCVRQLGGCPPTDGEFERVLSRGRGMIVGLVDDRAILAVIAASEADTEQACERLLECLGEDGADARLRDVVQRGLEDGRRHSAWLRQAIHDLQAHLKVMAAK